MTTIIAPHGVDKSSAHYLSVLSEMATLGAPTLRGVRRGDMVILVEGSHRLAAAEALGLIETAEIAEVDEDTEIAHDAEDLPSPCRAGDVADYFGADGVEQSRAGAIIVVR